MQCDFDTIGTLSGAADVETALVIHDLFLALGFDDFSIRVNNRMVLSGLLERLDLGGRSGDVLRALDKLPKIGPEKVKAEMVTAAGASETQADEVLRLAGISGSNDDVLKQLEPLVAGNETGQAGIARLAELLAATHAAGVPGERLTVDVSIARGLDYYTGVVYETFLGALPGIGSVCSGGRYDNLAGVYTSQQLPGVGASLGLDRLLAAMEELGMVQKVTTPADVFIPYFEKDRLHDYLRIAAALRAAGLGVEVYPEAKKLGPQLKHADRRGFRFALIVGADEFAENVCKLKDLAQRQEMRLSLENHAREVVQAVGDQLNLELGAVTESDPVQGGDVIEPASVHASSLRALCPTCDAAGTFIPPSEGDPARGVLRVRFECASGHAWSVEYPLA